MAIANSCPLSGGEAVLRARALLNLTQDAPVSYNDGALCGALLPAEGRGESGETGTVLLYPNPARDFLNLEYSFTSEGKNVFHLYNAYGQLVKEAAMENTKGKLSIPVRDLASGVYWYKVFSGKAVIHSGKLILVH